MQCRLCKSSQFESWISSRSPKVEAIENMRPDNFRVTDLQYGVTLSLRKCRDCGLIQAQAPARLADYYRDMTDFEYLSNETERRMAASYFLDQIGEICAKRLLDVGAGAGFLVEEAGRRGAFAEGIDLCAQFVELGKRSGRNLYRSSLENFESHGKQYDIITLLDVIEHVESPKELLESCMRLLRDDGILMIVTPDHGSFARRILGRKWWHYRIAHLTYFDMRTLKQMFEQSGFRLAKRFKVFHCFKWAYFCERVEKYLPFAGLKTIGLLSKDKIVKLSFGDSIGVILSKK